MKITWTDGFRIRVHAENSTVVVSANKEGLLSLSGIMKTLAEEKAGSHIHLNEYNSLEENSAELIIEKIN